MPSTETRPVLPANIEWFPIADGGYLLFCSSCFGPTRWAFDLAGAEAFGNAHECGGAA